MKLRIHVYDYRSLVRFVHEWNKVHEEQLTQKILTVAARPPYIIVEIKKSHEKPLSSEFWKAVSWLGVTHMIEKEASFSLY